MVAMDGAINLNMLTVKIRIDDGIDDLHPDDQPSS
jgi:hypothetical protein